MNRSLRDVLGIIKELKGVYDAYQKAVADGLVSAKEGLGLLEQGIDILNKNKVTLEELRDLLTEIGPYFALFGK